MDDETRRRVEGISDVKRFCVEELGLAPNEAFTRLSNSQQIFHALYSCSKYEIEPAWDFQEFLMFKSGLGCKAYSVLDKATGLDTYIERVLSAAEKKKENIGSSTQITGKMLKEPESTMVQIVLHENVHMHLAYYRSKNIDRHIEEPIADYFAYQTSLMYYKDNKIMLSEIERIKTEEDMFKDWCRNKTEELSHAYRTDINKGRKILKQAGEEYNDTHDKKENINNAFFLSWMPYVKHARIVEEVLKDLDPKEYIQRLAHFEPEIYNIRQLRDIVKEPVRIYA